MLRYLAIALCFILAFVITFFFYSIKAMYSQSVIGLAVLAYAAISVSTLTSIIYLSINYKFRTSIAAVTLGAFIIGLMPYRIEKSRIIELFSNPVIEVSGMFNILPRPLGLLADGLFYIVLTFAVLLIVSLVSASAKGTVKNNW
tara:strand:- start:87 stop:518 length:432 start_codon:yes stop_codon:yes gene_type:complete